MRTLTNVARPHTAMGCRVAVIGPDGFRTLPCPTYPEIRLAVLPAGRLARLVEAFRPDALHIATEGPLGLAARRLARRRRWRFTTSFHTRFAEYQYARTGLPVGLSYAWLRRFHGAGSGVMVATKSMRDELAQRGFRDLRPWSRGVDLSLFTPAARDRPAGAAARADDPADDPTDPGADIWAGLPRPVFASIGRVAVEKNIPAFLALDLPGSKVVVGDGPMLAELRRAFPSAHFTGARHGLSLTRSFAGADVFVFPSRTDTFGLVMLESLACGTPVAAYPVTGPKDVLLAGGPAVGGVDEDLRAAALAALEHGDRTACRRYAEGFSWRVCAERFLGHLVPLDQASCLPKAAQ